MSIAYNARKKEKSRQLLRDIVEIESGNIPEHLTVKYPDKDKAYILAACKALWDYNKLVKRMIRQGKVSRYVLAKDGKGSPLFRCWKKCKGIYKFSKSETRIVIGQHMKQVFIGTEMQRAAEEKFRG